MFRASSGLLIALSLVVTSVPADEALHDTGWYFESITQEQMDSAMVLARKMEAFAAGVTPGWLGHKLAELDPSGDTHMVAAWLKELATAEELTPDWPGVHRALVDAYGENLVNDLLEPVRLSGGRAYPPNGRSPSSWTLSVIAWAWQHPGEETARVITSASTWATAGEDEAIFVAIAATRESYADLSCSNHFIGRFDACHTFAQARRGETKPAHCTGKATGFDCDDGHAATVVARITINELGPNNEILNTRLADDFAATQTCATATCGCGIDFDY